MVPKKLKNQILDIFKPSKYINVLEFGANYMWFKIYVLSFTIVGFTQKKTKYASLINQNRSFNEILRFIR